MRARLESRVKSQEPRCQTPDFRHETFRLRLKLILENVKGEFCFASEWWLRVPQPPDIALLIKYSNE